MKCARTRYEQQFLREYPLKIKQAQANEEILYAASSSQEADVNYYNTARMPCLFWYRAV